MFRDTGGLSRELRQAVGKLEEAIEFFRFSQPQELPTGSDLGLLFQEGFLSFHVGPIKTSQLPRESDWIWNQSRGKTTLISTDGDLIASFFKLNTRSCCHSIPPPVKLWVFNVDVVSIQRRWAFLWCEASEK